MIVELSVQIHSMGVFLPVNGKVENFKARKLIPDRKSIKLMTRSVQLGVAAASVALRSTDVWQAISPSRRGIFVSAAPCLDDHFDLQSALRAAHQDGQFSLKRFATDGMSLIHPLWLVRGLSNNILGFTSSMWDFQGENMNYCQGHIGGKHAFIQAAKAIEEGRLECALVGGADVLTGAEEIYQKECAEAAVFFVIGPSESSMKIDLEHVQDLVNSQPVMGAAGWLAALHRSLETASI